MRAEQHLDDQVGRAFYIVAALCVLVYGGSAIGFIIWAVTHWH